MTTLKTVAHALRDRFRVDAALCWMKFAAEIEPYCEEVIQGPRLIVEPGVRPERNGSPPSWGEHLGDLGFNQPALIWRHVKWWLAYLRKSRPSLLVAENAPCAMLAARARGVPVIAIGQGFNLPPATLERYPQLFPEHGDYLYDEAELVSLVNEAIEPLGVSPIQRLPEIYAGNDHLVRTLPLIDPYAEHRASPWLSPIAYTQGKRRGTGDEIFVYFSILRKSRVSVDEIAQALAYAVERFDAPVRAYLPAMDSEWLSRLAGKGLMIEYAPLPMEQIAERTRLLVNAGQHGSMCFGLAAGIPQICIPTQMEQLHNARRGALTKAIRVIETTDRNDANISEAINAAYEDEGMRRRAMDSAEEFEPFFRQDVHQQIRERVAAIV